MSDVEMKSAEDQNAKHKAASAALNAACRVFDDMQVRHVDEFMLKLREKKDELVSLMRECAKYDSDPQFREKPPTDDESILAIGANHSRHVISKMRVLEVIFTLSMQANRTFEQVYEQYTATKERIEAEEKAAEGANAAKH